jgi:hypothetical protein
MTTRLAKILIASTALAILPATLACAGANNPPPPPPPAKGSVILNGQLTFGAQWSTINTKVVGVGGDVAIQGQAAGNALEAITFDDTNLKSTQDSESTNIGSEINAGVSYVNGSVSISGQATCNATDVSTDPNVTNVNSKQICNAQDPGSAVNATVHNIGGDAAISSAAAGNSFSEDTNAVSSPTLTHQFNTSSVFSTVNANVNSVGGSVGVTSSAVGNTAQIVHYATGP